MFHLNFVSIIIATAIALVAILVTKAPFTSDTSLASSQSFATEPSPVSETHFISPTPSTSMTALRRAMSHAKIVHRPSSTRGHADHGWLNTYHSFSFANWYDPKYMSFGALRVLNEDRVAPGTGFPTHPHRDAEIFSYILSGELTHRDSINKAEFYRMKRGDVQFTTGGTGIAHSEQNEGDKWVHFLQIWVTPYKKGLKPAYHTGSFPDADKRQGFVNIIPSAIPINADLAFSAGILSPGTTFDYAMPSVDAESRKLYIHLPMVGDAKVKIGDVVLNPGDGAFVTNITKGEVIQVESIGTDDAEVVILDSN